MAKTHKRRWRLWRVLIWLAVAAVPTAFAIAAALPGPHRLACPQCYGLREIGDRVYVDAAFTERDERRLLDAIRIGRQRAAAFFGEVKGRPRIAACKSQACLDIFGGGGAKAVAYGWHAIRMSPTGLNATIASHELIHIELHWRLGAVGLWGPSIPAWFDEGLAVILSEDTRFRRRVAEQHVRAVMQVKTFRDWSRFTKDVGWRTSYGAAATAVRRLDRKLGRSGLKRFIDRVLQGADFDETLAKTKVF